MADSGPGGKIRVSPANNVYTVWLIVATLFLFFGTVWLAIMSNELFGTWLPVGP